MIFITFETKNATLHDIKQVAQRILDHHQREHFLTQLQESQLHTIIRPTLKADQNESEIRQLWQELIETLVVTNKKGEELRFHRDDEQGVLYFGDEAGWHTAKAFHDDQTIHKLHTAS